MKRVLVAALAVVFVASNARAEKSAPFPWDHEGYCSLLAAAKDAKDHSKRLLVGLSGGPT